MIWTSLSPAVRRSWTLVGLSVLDFISLGAMNVGMTLKIGTEIRSEFAKKTELNPSFQCVYGLPGQLKESKLCLSQNT